MVSPFRMCPVANGAGCYDVNCCERCQDITDMEDRRDDLRCWISSKHIGGSYYTITDRECAQMEEEVREIETKLKSYEE